MNHEARSCDRVSDIEQETGTAEYLNLSIFNQCFTRYHSPEAWVRCSEARPATILQTSRKTVWPVVFPAEDE